MSPVGNGTAAEMRDALERVGRGVLDYLDGDPGVQTMCPLCAHGIVLWTEQHRRWICNQPDCPGREDSSQIAYALEGEGPGGFAGLIESQSSVSFVEGVPGPNPPRALAPGTLRPCDV